MGQRKGGPNRGDCQQPTAHSLLGQPLAFIHEDHLRERHICTLIDQLADDQSPPPRTAVAAVLDFLQDELPLHLMDEEEDLFPLLRRRCEADDEIDKVLERLLSDHGHAVLDSPRIAAILKDLKDNARAPDATEREALMDFAAQSRRHLILENAIILPFARLRLTERDIETLRLRMCQRRGLDYPKETGHAEQPA